jgi:hypothetical protein
MRLTFLTHLFLIITLIVLSCNNDIAVRRHNFIGTWQIISATYDGFDQPVWKDKIISFEQINYDSGTYHVQDTPYDSIWSTTGKWKKINNENAFIRHDAIIVQCGFNQNISLMSLYFLLSPEPVPCTDPPCLPDVLGNWVFTCKKLTN